MSAQAEGLRVWVVYDHPKDHPQHWVVRLWVVTADGSLPEQSRLADSLDAARALIPAGAIRFDRMPADDPTIKETWL